MTKRGTLVLLVRVTCFPNPATGQKTLEAVPFVVAGRSVDIQIDYGNGTVGGTETLTLRNIASRSVIEVPLLLNRLMTVSRVSDTTGHEMVVRQSFVLFQDDSTLQVNAAVITLPQPVLPGRSVALVIRYGGHLVGYVETGSLYIQDRVDTAFTIIREDAFAFPALGVPSRSVNRAMGFDHPFTFVARVTVPAGLVVATGGVAAEPSRHDSLITWTYHSVTPAPVLNIAIAPYRTLDRAGLRIFYFAQDSDGARMVDRAVAGAMGLFAAWYGPIEQSAPLTIIEIPEGWGSQASLAGGIIETADAFRDRTQLYQLYHELSHLWNAPDRDQPSPRWNEGLAMFLQWRTAAQLDGWADWEGRIDRVERSLRAECQPPTPCGTVPFAEYGQRELTGLSYSVGMAMFYALFTTLGPTDFDRAYRDYFQRHRETGATSADLRSAFHNVSNTTDQIFADWFATTTWYQRLSTGESLRHIVNGYHHP